MFPEWCRIPWRLLDKTPNPTRTSLAWVCVFAVGLFLGEAHNLHADVLYLKNGRVLLGKIVGQTRQQVRVRTSTGVRTIPKRAIRKVSYNPAEEQALVRRREQARREAMEADRRARARVKQPVVVPKPPEKKVPRKIIPETVAPGKTVPVVALPEFAAERLWRSAVLPGWGLLFMERPRPGYWYMGTSLGLLAYSLYASRTASAARNASYESAGLAVLASNTVFTESTGRLAASFALSSAATGEYRADVRSANNAAVLFMLVYLAQLTHTYFAGKPASPGRTARGAQYTLEFRPEAAFAQAREPGTNPRRMDLRATLRLDF